MRKLVIRTANCPDRLGSWDKFVDNSKKLTCLEITGYRIKPLNAKLNSICHLLALLGAHQILHVSGVKVK
jgi:hypothetical protein